ncbi:hypothetical protein GO730_21420 [Spirosoma sp. HMF3257]|uniref:Glycosyltransferase family 9 protein n=1 Tax=Spirosoma telluris TaxID=2183553 RepID=A0A327NLK4_9BACT|nr:hypothetical protein [Spirosoma telluris]RAI76092.1 hypothetical protein HMF3257_21340 [Spirosoma telluris]
MERGNQYLKTIDRYIGIPFIWFLGLLRPRNRKIPLQINRIAIIKGAAIGDTVLLSAIIQDIRMQYPDVELLFFCGKTCVDTAKMIPGLSKVIFIPTTRPFEAITILRKAGLFDLVIDTGPWARLEAIFAYFTKGNYKIGFRSLKQYRHYGYDLSVEHSNQQHELENNRDLIRPFILECNSLPILTPSSIESKIICGQVGLAKPFWILHPWSGGFKGHYKEWLPERWVELAIWLVAQDYEVAFSGAKADKRQTDILVDTCTSRGVSVINLSGKTSLGELTALIRASQGVVSVNTGILHIAAALGAPVIGLNGPVPTSRWGAISAQAINIDAQEPGCGYIHLGFEYPSTPPNCMASINTTDVKTAILHLMSREKLNSSS